MRKIAIILAAGSGTRAGGKIPKQLQILAGKPVFAHSMEKFLQNDHETEIILVINPAYQDQFVDFIDEISKCTPFKFSMVAGGDSRAASVLNALDTLIDIDGNTLIAVHDAARPLVSTDMIERGWRAAQLSEAAVPVIPMTDSLRHLESEGKSCSVPRKNFVAVQTPQVFNANLLQRAYNILRSGSIDSEIITDDASVVEAAGHEVALYDGEPDNMKITGPFDIRIAELIIKNRIGN